MTIEELLIKHEGLREFPYKDTVGKLTIGIGRNLDDRGITEDEALYMLRNDIRYFTNELSDKLDWFDTVPEDVKMVMIDICFNCGIGGFLQFRKALGHLKNANYKMAADEFLNSKWATQVGNRSLEDANILKSIENNRHISNTI